MTYDNFTPEPEVWLPVKNETIFKVIFSPQTFATHWLEKRRRARGPLQSQLALPPIQAIGSKKASKFGRDSGILSESISYTPFGERVPLPVKLAENKKIGSKNQKRSKKPLPADHTPQKEK